MTHVISGQLVLRGRLHGDAQLAVLEHGKQAQAQNASGADHHHLLGCDHQTAQAQNFTRIGHGQGVGVCTHVWNHGDQAAQHIAHTNGQHHNGKSRLPQDGTNDQALKQHPKNAHGQDGRRHSDPKGKAQQRHGGQA